MNQTLLNAITDAFTKLGYTPRGNQEKIIHDVLDAFLTHKKKSVVLCADTGVGKSIIGAVVAECLSTLDESDEKSSIIMMGTNSLAKQYHDSFENLGPYKFFQIKGASNYACPYMESRPDASTITAEECVRANLHPVEEQRYCSNCEFWKAKQMVNKTDNLITNYSYYLTSALISEHLAPRKLNVFDEAHLLNDVFCNFTEISLSVMLIDKYIKELSELGDKVLNETSALVMLKDKLSNSEISDGNYKQYLKVLAGLFTSISVILNTQSGLLVSNDLVKSAKYSKMSRKYSNFSRKIDDLFEREYDHVFDSSVPATFSIKTIFIGEMMNNLLSKYNLFMSATITQQFAYETLDLDKETTQFIQTDAVFPAENKPLFFIGKVALNYAAMKDDSIIDDLKQKVKKIVAFHKGQKGIILVPSFYLGSQMVRSLRGTKVFEHTSGSNISDIISDFKRYKGDAVLVSPSIFEGLDFKNDDSRFQIIVKSPFPSLGDKRIKYIADKYPLIYQEMTLIKILQGIGRSIRTPEDSAATYLLDASSKKLFDSRLNIWKNRYNVISA